MIAVTTTSSTDSEVLRFAIYESSDTGQKYPLAEYALTLDMAIIDASLVMERRSPVCAFRCGRSISPWSLCFVLASELSDESF